MKVHDQEKEKSETAMHHNKTATKDDLETITAQNNEPQEVRKLVTTTEKQQPVVNNSK